MTKRYGRILFALILHDVKSRFFGTGVGQIFVILWPVAHILLLLLIYYATGRAAAYGSSLLLYSSVGLTPFIIWSYSSRWIVLAGIQNRPFLQYSIVKPLDILVARSLLEFISSLLIAAIVAIILIIFGAYSAPNDSLQLLFSFIASFLLATAFGLLGGMLSYLTPFTAMFYNLIIIVAYATSGILFVPSQLPHQLGEVLSYNPVLQLVEWTRSAFYAEYPQTLLDRGYVFAIILIMISMTLLTERCVRKFF